MEFAPPAWCTELVVLWVPAAIDEVLAGVAAGIATSCILVAAGCAAAAAAGAAMLVDAGATLGTTMVVQPLAACLQHQFC